MPVWTRVGPKPEWGHWFISWLISSLVDWPVVPSMQSHYELVRRLRRVIAARHLNARASPCRPDESDRRIVPVHISNMLGAEIAHSCVGVVVCFIQVGADEEETVRSLSLVF